MQIDLARLTMLHQAVGNYIQIESPPPVAARSFIARHIEPFFEGMPAYARNGVAPGGVRYRMWRLSSRIIETHCRSIGCDYIRCPRSVLDANGFLDQRFGGNATHANELYGEEVIRSLETMLADPASEHHPAVRRHTVQLSSRVNCA